MRTLYSNASTTALRGKMRLQNLGITATAIAGGSCVKFLTPRLLTRPKLKPGGLRLHYTLYRSKTSSSTTKTTASRARARSQKETQDKEQDYGSSTAQRVSWWRCFLVSKEAPRSPRPRGNESRRRRARTTPKNSR